MKSAFDDDLQAIRCDDSLNRRHSSKRLSPLLRRTPSPSYVHYIFSVFIFLIIVILKLITYYCIVLFIMS